MHRNTLDPNDARLRGFDAEWYARTYPDVALSALDPAQHYLLCGIPLGRAKGPDALLNTAARQPKDIAALFGYSDIEVLPQPEQGPIVSVFVEPAQDYATYDLAGSSKMDTHLARVLLGNTSLGHSHDVGILLEMAEPVRTLGRMLCGAQAAQGLVTVQPNPQLTQSQNEDTATDSDNSGATPVSGVAAKSLLLEDCVAPVFRHGPAQIRTAWLATTTTLRIAIAGGEGDVKNPAATLSAWQPDAQDLGRLMAVGGGGLPTSGPGFVDLVLSSPLMPVLLELSDSDGLTLGFALIPFPSLLRGGLHAVERAAHQQGPDPMSEVWRLGTALLRDFLAGPRDSGFAVARLCVRTDTATGAEPVFSTPVREWLRALFGLGLAAAQGSVDETDLSGTRWLRTSLDRSGHERGAGMTLELPARGLPTLQALVSRRMAMPDGCMRAAGPFLVSDAVSQRPLWSVSIPLQDETSPDMPVLIRTDHTGNAQTGLAAHWLAPLHLAVICVPSGPVHDSLQLYPVAPDAPYLPQLEAPMSVVVVLTASDPELVMRALSSLRFQHEITIDQVLVRGAHHAQADQVQAACVNAKEMFPRRVRQIAKETGTLADLDQILQETDGAHILMLDEAVAFQDSRIVSSMAADLIRADDIASVGCTLLYESLKGKHTALKFGSAGLFPAAVSLISAPRLTVIEPDVLMALPASTYPVLANTFGLCLVRRAAFEATRQSRAALVGAVAADLHFGLSSYTAGWRNLCTTRVRAGTTRMPTRRDEIDPFGLDCILPSSWDGILQSVAVLRELRG